jgi:cytochrome c
MSDELQFNKYMGAVLGTVAVILVVGFVSEGIYHTEPPKTPGDKVAVVEAAAPAAEAPDLLPDWGTVLPTADVAAGQATFAKCQACHNNANGGPNLIGPNLWGVVGRPTASHAGFAYSTAMQAHAKDSPNWTYDQLYQFLKNPQVWVPGTKMGFAGLKDGKDRVNVIAYLRSQGSTGYAIPGPDPKRAPGAAAAPAPAGATAAPAAADPAAAATKPGDAGGAASGDKPK